MKKLIVFGLVFGFLGGCASSPSRKDFPRDKVKDIVVGKTTEREIYDIFGMPIYHGQRTVEEPWWIYIHTKDNNSESLSLYFDKEGLVSDLLYSPYRQTLEDKLQASK